VAGSVVEEAAISEMSVVVVVVVGDRSRGNGVVCKMP
jgi:hypothetical protein